MNKPGYILVLTLMIISISIFLVTNIVHQGLIFFPFAQTAVRQQKALELALGGLEVSLSQLAQSKPHTEEQKKQDENKKQESPAQALLATILPVLNQWQTFTFTQEKDGLEGTLRICLMSEDGKININELFDFQKHTFIGPAKTQEEVKKALQHIFSRIEKITNTKDLFTGFEKFLKERQYRINDITELLTIKEFAQAFDQKLWYKPSDTAAQEKKEQPVYLTDIFTLWTHTPTMQPWLLSSSLILILGLKNPDRSNKEKLTTLLQQFKPSVAWPTAWATTMEPWYTTPWASLAPEIQPLMSPEFSARTFSVLVHARVDSAQQYLYGIIERSIKNQKNETDIQVSIKKVYWL